MEFGAAVQALVDRTKRADKVTSAQEAINGAIGLFATKTWARDLVETQIALVSTAYFQQIDTSALFTRFRKIKYLRPTGYSKYLAWRDPSRVFHDGMECLDVWYQGGVILNFKLSRLQDTCQVGYYQYHLPLVEDNDADWMLDLIWPAVQAYALAEMFDEIGDSDSANRYTRRWPTLLDAYFGDLGDNVSHA